MPVRHTARLEYNFLRIHLLLPGEFKIIKPIDQRIRRAVPQGGLDRSLHASAECRSACGRLCSVLNQPAAPPQFSHIISVLIINISAEKLPEHCAVTGHQILLLSDSHVFTAPGPKSIHTLTPFPFLKSFLISYTIFVKKGTPGFPCLNTFPKILVRYRFFRYSGI